MPIEISPSSTRRTLPEAFTLWEDAEEGDVYLLTPLSFSTKWAALNLSDIGGFWKQPTDTAEDAVTGLTPYNGTVTISN